MFWFKHYSTASENRSLNHLMDEFGVQGYAWYFLLLELCSDQWDGKSKPKFTFHQRILRLKLRTTLTKVRLFLDLSQSLGQLTYTFTGKEFHVSIPKLLEIKSSRKLTKNSKDAIPIKPQGEVEKDIEIDKNKDKELDTEIEKNKNKKVFGADEIFSIWNDVIENSDGKLSKAVSLNPARIKKIKTCIKNYTEMQTPESWKLYFEKICTVPFLNGGNDRQWRVDFDWVINTNNLLKIVEGRYDTIKDNSARGKMNTMLTMESPYATE